MVGSGPEISANAERWNVCPMIYETAVESAEVELAFVGVNLRWSRAGNFLFSIRLANFDPLSDISGPEMWSRAISLHYHFSTYFQYKNAAHRGPLGSDLRAGAEPQH